MEGTNAIASVDETVITGQHVAWRRSFMYSVFGELGGRTGSLDESQNPYIWTAKETEIGVNFQQQVAVMWVTGPLAELGMVAMMSRVRLLRAGWTSAKGGVQYTRSSLRLGQQMHRTYKVGANGVKEFRLPSGRRIDFLDIENRIIYELKPFNPRAMQAGQKQLQMYMQELQTMPQFNGINWKTVLDTY